MCVSGCRAAAIQVDFAEEHIILGLRRVKHRKRKGPSQGVIQHTGSHERGLFAPKVEDRSEEKTLKQERCARRVLGKWFKSILKVNDQKSAGYVTAPPQNRRSVARKESAETKDHVSAPPSMNHFDQILDVKDETNLEELGVSEPRWAGHVCDKKCRERASSFCEVAAIVTEEGGCDAHDQSLQALV